MLYNPYTLIGKTILITGASSGIGKSTAIEASKLGAHLIITGRNKERLNRTFKALEKGNHQMFLGDLSKTVQIEKLMSTLPKIDGLSHNIGLNKTLPVLYYKEKDIMDLLRINTIIPMLLTRSLLKHKKVKLGGSLVYTSSISGLTKNEKGSGLYASSKAALTSFVKTLAYELAVKKTRVNSVHPGMVMTPMIEREEFSDEQRSNYLNKYPLMRYGEPREIALAIIYLLSDASQWVTGTSLLIDGGTSLI